MLLQEFLNFFQLTVFNLVTWKMVMMWGVVVVLMYLAIAKGFEPLLLIPIAFGALLANLPTSGVRNKPAGPIPAPYPATVVAWHVKVGDEVRERDRLATLRVREMDGRLQEITLTSEGRGTVIALNAAPGEEIRAGQTLLTTYSTEPGGLYYYISKGIELEIFPPLIFLGVGALTDFGPLIAKPITLLLGAAAQVGVAVTFLGAALLGFTQGEAASIAIIGGADGPTAIFTASKLAPDLLPAIAVAAYSYMSLVPLIQPPIMRLLTTRQERLIRMRSLRRVGRLERLAFALVVCVFCILVVPSASALIGMLMLGNFLRECGVVDRLVDASQNAIINIITIFLGTSVGIMMEAERFLQPQTLSIIALGVVAFGASTAGGVIMAKLLNLVLREKINPLIGSAGVSAVPMAARVSHNIGQKYDPNNYLLMHAMGPNVSGVIGTAVIAGYYISTLTVR